jgi:RimJ/RimL family protein N-acetyltransferase
MIISTARLRLRAAEPKDVDAFVRSLNDWEVQQWLTQPPFPYSHQDGEAFLAIVRANHAAPHPTTFVIADQGTDAAIGVAAVDIDQGGTGVLGYWLAREHWGRGLAREAISALLGHAVAHPELRRLVAVTDPDNIRSQRVLAACGLADHGLRDRRQASRRGSRQVRSYELALIQRSRRTKPADS